MARYGSVITRAVVEQEICFDNDFYFNAYIHKLDYNEEPYKIISKEYKSGKLFVVIRKRYGEYPFLGDIDPSTISEQERLQRDASRGASRDVEGVLIITDCEKYRAWQDEKCRKSRY